jgi:hypothetical protein
MGIEALLSSISNQLGAIGAGHQASGSGALKAVAVLDVPESFDRAVAAALEALVSDLVCHLLAPLFVALLMAQQIRGVNDY